MRLTPCLLAVLLAACGGGEDSGEGDTRSATGEVLEGTISDAMLPLDRVKSQAPLAEPVEAPVGTSEDAAAETDEAAAVSEEPTTEAAPAE